MKISDFTFMGWNTEFVSTFPQQGIKTFDCGVFIMKAMECVATDKQMIWTEHDGSILRKRLFLRIMDVAKAKAKP